MKNPFYIRSDPTADLLIVGEDAAEFLQGQFTNDLRGGRENEVTYGLWLNQKGRVLADSFIWRANKDSFRVLSEWSGAAAIRERLEAYIIADDVAVEDRTVGTAGWVLGGPRATDWIKQLGLPVPPSGFHASAAGALIFAGRWGGRSSWRLLVPQADAPAWEEKIAGVAGVDGRGQEAAVVARRIADGIPSVPDELGPGDLPNEGGLEYEAISYTKGCYLGQEVMSRLKNLGRVRRKLHVVRGSGGDLLPALRSALMTGDRRVGDLRSVLPDADGWIGLAMLHTDAARSGQRLCVEGGEFDSVLVDRVAEGRAW